MINFQNIWNNVMEKRLAFRKEVIDMILRDFKLSNIEELKDLGFTLNTQKEPNGDETLSVMDDDTCVMSYKIESKMHKEDDKFVMKFVATPTFPFMQGL